MKYMLLMYGVENSWNDEERKDCMLGCLEVCDELAAQGKFIATSPLHSVRTAKTVRVRDGRQLIMDGPFAETTEQLGGYFLLELADLDEAIEVASRLPPVRKGTAEIRPLSPLDGVPPSRPFPVGSKDPNGTPYILLVYHNEEELHAGGEALLQKCKTDAAARCCELKEAGKYLNASPLHLAETATCVRMRDGKREIFDGPFAETHEVLGGFYLVLAKSHDEALQIAAQQPGARIGSMEVRELFDLSGLHTSVSIS